MDAYSLWWHQNVICNLRRWRLHSHPHRLRLNGILQYIPLLSMARLWVVAMCLRAVITRAKRAATFFSPLHAACSRIFIYPTTPPPPAARSHLSHRCFFALSATCLHVERMCSLFVWRVACSRQWDKWYAQEAFDKLHVMVYSIGFFQVLLFIGRYRVWEKKNISLTA